MNIQTLSAQIVHYGGFYGCKRVHMQQDLIQLKEFFFDKIENYKEYESANVGFRSLKNIGVWLCVFAMYAKNTSTLSIYNQIVPSSK